MLPTCVAPIFSSRCTTDATRDKGSLVAPRFCVPTMARDELAEVDHGSEEETEALHAQYKAEVVQLVRTGGKLGEVSRHGADRDVGAGVGQSGRGRQQGSPGALTTAERDEFTVLKREVKTLRLERDILKKATAFFAKEST